MKKCCLGATLVALTLWQAPRVMALPGYGADCQSCHGGARGTVTITANDTTANPVEACGSADLGTVKVFQVTQGATKRFSGTLSGLASAAHYTTLVKGFETAGIEHCGTLAYTGDATWKLQSSTAPVYYVQPTSTTFFTWPGTSAFNFDITVGASTPPDYYDLVLATAGKDGSGRFYAEGHLYVQVVAPAPAKPTIALNKTTMAATVTQGASPANDSFTVANSGAGTLNYTISDNATWLTVTPASGSTTVAANTITVQYSTASLTPGTYPATITVTDANATNNPQTINVTLTVNAAPKPTIALNKTTMAATVTQGASPANDSFTVANSGAATLNYTISDNVTWLTATPASGSTTAAANTITVQYSTASLAAGTYPATITVTDTNATNNPQTINVTLTVNAAPKPTIALNKTTMSATATQGASPANDSFTVANSGAGTLNYTISDNATWLTATPASGSTTAAANTITVQYSTASLAAGTYPATITVTDTNATNNPQTINVTLTVNAAPKPTIALSKTTMTMGVVEGVSMAGDTFTVANSGAGTLNYTISDSAAWLTVTPASGTSTGAANTHTVQYNTASLVAGTYPATITVTDVAATNNPQTINVTLTVSATPKPAITLSKSTLAPTAVQGTSPASDTFTVANTGLGTLNYTVSDNATWLSVSPTSGSSTGPAGTITVQYSTASMTPGTYPATITVTDAAATNNPQTVNVTLTITPTPKPTIALNKATLSPAATEGASPADATFTVSNSGQATLNYTISSSASWLMVSPAMGTSTGPANTHTVKYSTAGMTPGTYPATITVTDASATNNPQTVGVTLTVNAVAAPSIVLSKTTLNASAAEGSQPSYETFTVANGGGGTVSYSITSSEAWLTVSPASGTSTGAANTHTAQCDTTGMLAGSYPATITVSDAGGVLPPQTISVTLTVNAVTAGAPSIVLSKTTLNVRAAKGIKLAPSSFRVSNGGEGTLNYAITTDAAWLKVSPDSGASSGLPQWHKVVYDTTALAAGSYTATITVSDPAASNNPQTIQVNLTIRARTPRHGDDDEGEDAHGRITYRGDAEERSGHEKNGDDDKSVDAADRPLVPACGAGSAGMLPAMLLGLAALRAGFVRRRGGGSRLR